MQRPETAIIIGAGRGIRLSPLTDDLPKCFIEIAGKRILDWILHALRSAGIENIVFVGGYKIDAVKAEFPEMIFCHNEDWRNYNILASLLTARPYMDGPFITTYADIVYEPDAVTRLLNSPHDITLVSDIDWRSRYVGRTHHPETDAEKLRSKNGQVLEIGRQISSAEATGEFIGVARFTQTGAERFLGAYDLANSNYDSGPFREAASLYDAYLVHLLQEMIEAEIPIHAVDIQGGYFEIDTPQDHELAKAGWTPT